MYTFIGHNVYNWSHLGVKIINIMNIYEVESITDLFMQQYGFTWKFCELQSHVPYRALQLPYIHLNSNEYDLFRYTMLVNG